MQNGNKAILCMAVMALLLVSAIGVSGCTTAYPTQTVTVTEKFVRDPTALDWFPQYYIIDQDGLAIKIFSNLPQQESAMYTSMQKGHTYICDIGRCNDGSSYYCIMEIVKEV